ncbi:gephyrin-like molybdotransferase receptor GlpR [Mycobacterium sp. GA-2829]|uniref:divisome protein SepX/GlpR n=1 Tax=Mycobacterium sp. GA-2829 TaxID=1772283 RepID=UPI0007404A52|nr:gephyrin-like molybdotransferase receptor GlpR [Mycobacterium sp. GA-2829]KUI24406.1 hypothetical protein AU194_27490 [Mycobacterium sp. GA-2829]
MPSIPQSLLWISLVVLWLFVLVPMLVSKRDAVRRTSDVALATRVLTSGETSRLLRRSGPAAGHHSDPDWRPSAEDRAVAPDDDLDEEPRQAVVLATAPAREEPDYLDVDVVEEDPGALPVGTAEADLDDLDEVDEIADDATESDEVEVETDAEDAVEPEAGTDRETEDEYEYVPDSSGLETPADDERDEPAVEAVGAARRRRYESKTAEAVSARKFRFRKRMVTSLGVALLASALLAYLLAPWAWWLCGGVGAITVLYLGYLRRQTRIEEQLRRRRAQRLRRSRLGVENTDDPELDVVPARLRRPGAAVLEIDDEDPIFEHLDEVAFARHYDLPRAAGQ